MTNIDFLLQNDYTIRVMSEEKTNQENIRFTTPMMRQYQAIKEQHQDCLLFFRLGDFYELFHDDAKLGAQILNITLTRRPRGKDGDIPMAGVPFHAADVYIAKLVKAGHKVAICEQVSPPNNKGIVEREVVRIITPGTILDEHALTKKEHNYLMSIALGHTMIGIAVADLSTGDFQATQVSPAQDIATAISAEIVRFTPSECIVSHAAYHRSSLLQALAQFKDLNVFCYPAWDEYADDAKGFLASHFHLLSLESFGMEDKPLAAKAAAGLLGYLKETQKEQLSHILHISTYQPEDYLLLDRSTVTNLELFRSLRDQDYRRSLIGIIDKTSTPMGGRLLREWLKKPLRDKQAIDDRLEAVAVLADASSTREQIIHTLIQLADIPRLISRCAVGTGNAHDLLHLAESLQHIKRLKLLLHDASPPLLQACVSTIVPTIDEIISLIQQTIADHPPIDLKNGGLIRSGVDQQLDTLRKTVANARQWLAQFETDQRKRTGIASLKVKFNKVFGYYIEVTKPNVPLVPKDYFRKQTMVNAERYITQELKQYEETILNAQEKINGAEYAIFSQTVEQLLAYTPTITAVAKAVAAIDCLTSFATLAESHQYVRPVISLEGTIEIIQGRHPVVEQLQETPFAPNDTSLNNTDHQLLILTGPNMAGKSVYMRQVALIVLLAHLGSFVPAAQATIHLTDRIFARSGASDVITQGLSTFMVEMVETAHILVHATSDSLIIMDEIGRGTSTYDGISIAWAVAEHLVTHPAAHPMTLFATHYHELQMLENRFPDRIKNYTLLVKQKPDGDPIFLHTVQPGRASHSYAVAVAKLAGVPQSVTRRADQLLDELEHERLAVAQQPMKKHSLLTPEKPPDPDEHVITMLRSAALPSMTPIEALNFLADLQKRLNG